MVCLFLTHILSGTQKFSSPRMLPHLWTLTSTLPWTPNCHASAKIPLGYMYFIQITFFPTLPLPIFWTRVCLKTNAKYQINIHKSERLKIKHCVHDDCGDLAMISNWSTYNFPYHEPFLLGQWYIVTKNRVLQMVY